jgi:hypothetical protein
MERLVIVRSRQSTNMVVWCETCACLTRMLTVDEAAVVARSTSREIYRRVEAGELHFMETPEGSLFICFESIV